MLKRWPAEALDRELARRNPVADSDFGDAAHTPTATALLRQIFELADRTASAGADGGAGAGTRVGLAGTDAAADAGDDATRPEGAGGLIDPDRRPKGGVPAWGPSVPRTGYPVRRVATALALVTLLAGGTSAIVLTVTGTSVPHRTTTGWLASRPLAADVRSAPAMGTTVTRSPWQLVGDLVPAGWMLGTAGPGPGTVTCPTTTVCYVTGDTSASASGPSVVGGLYVSTNGASTWSVLALPQGFTFTTELTCVSALTCAAGGMEDGTAVFAETRDGGHRWTVTTTGAAGGLVHLTCVSARRCMALALPPSDAQAVAGGTSTPRPFDEAFVRTTDGGNSWTATVLPATVDFTSLQCPSVTACITVGYPAGTTGASPHGVALRTDDRGLRWVHGSLPAGIGFSGMSGLSCSGPVRCMAVATVAVPNPAPCSTVLQPTKSATLTQPTSSSCTSALDTWVSTMISTDNDGATWQSEPLPASVPQPRLDNVACAGPLTCWAGGQEAAPSGRTAGSSVLIGTADGGATWMAATVPVPAHAPNDQRGDAYATVGSISCPSTTVCVALGVVDQGARSAPVYRMDVAP